MSRKILVADDEPDLKDLIRQIFRSRIKSGEFTFDFAENGAIALEKLKADPEIEVLFTDINMPVMDGLTLLNNIKEDGLVQKAVVISAYGDLKNIRTAMNRGAFDFVTKPIDISDLEATLTKAISEMEVFRKGLDAIKENERLILEQNEILEQQVKERTAEIVQQKEIIVEKNKEILDSIHYAKRLQAAILPPNRQMNELFSQHFTLYMPKDIVAGDFYWMESLGDYIYLVAADCTGHGVSGALMSMLGVSLLSRVVNEKQITEPGEILNALHLSVIAALKQQENETHDGMDILLCRFNKDFSEIHFAGANRPLWLVRNNILEEFKTDKMPVGGLQVEHNSFTTQTLTLIKGDMLYLSTDGYADQFGGEAGKKLMTKKFKEVLAEISGMNMTEQKDHLYKVHEDWRGNNEQVDDILVIGLRLG
ncbi:MAG: response regulator [Bacteroidota bacterium]